jgi:hypothetical protein
MARTYLIFGDIEGKLDVLSVECDCNGVTLLAKFDGEFASHAQTYSGTGTLRWTW